MNFRFKRFFILSAIVAALAIFSIACNTDKTAAPPDTKTAGTKATAPVYYNVGVSTEPGEVKPGQPVKLTFNVQDGAGRAVDGNGLDIVHEKLMHLLVVSEDLSYFDHIHPEPNAGGDFTVDTKLPAAGKYKLYLDYTPKGAGHQLGRMDVTVAGTPAARVPLVADKEDFKVIGDVKVTMKPDKPFKTNEMINLNFLISDAKTGNPVTDLQPYLGAFAHFVLISEDTTEYLHAHPLKEAEGPNAKGGPEVGTQSIFPKIGLYKVWAQFQRNGKIIIAPFVINVTEGAAKAPAVLAQNDGGVQKIKVTVSEKGYEPASLQLKRGIPAEITFFRADEKNCGNEVVFSELGIRKELKVGQEVIVNLVPDKDGQFSFGCGMGMLRGSLVVN